MSDESDHISDRARFAAREFVARFDSEMGGGTSALVVERMLFAYEMGYLRGSSEKLEKFSADRDELLRVAQQASFAEGEVAGLRKVLELETRIRALEGAKEEPHE